MDFDEAKENIQPLAQGRNASILHASLRVESPQELLAHRKVLEKEIHEYTGEDPLSVWYNYIEWIEQSFPSGGKESGLQEVLSKCLAQFEGDDRYKQDRRMIKLYIKFIDSHKEPAECYQQLFNAGIGTMVADFYIAWAYCYDMVGNTRKADEIFLRGIACRAQPLEDLQEARQHFGFSVSQLLMYKDDDQIREETNRQLHERRMALTSLRAHRRKHVGSLRTGSAVKSISPGKIKVDLPSTSSQHGNARVQVFKDENENPHVVSSLHDSASANEPGKSVVRSIIDAARDQENQKEPGPWNKAHSRKKGKLFGGSKVVNELGFEIHEDDIVDDSENERKPCNPPIPIDDNEIKFDKPFIYPPNFCAISKPIKGWITPVTTEEKPDSNTLPEYNKCKLYPRPNMEFQPEELKAYNIFKKRDIQNNFTKERDIYFGCGPQFNIRMYPNFATNSKAQTTDSLDQYFMPEKVTGLKVAFDEIYKKEGNIERQFEEILALRIKPNETITETADMEETMCTTSDKVQRRKSFFPIRKSMAPSSYKGLIKTSIVPEQNEFLEKSPKHELKSNVSIASTSVKVIEEKSETKPEIIQKSNTLETPQTVEQQTIPSVVTETTVKSAESQNLFIQNVNELQTHVVAEKAISKPVSPIPFEIFIDESGVESKCIKNVQDENDFKFKTPALPIASSTSVAAVPRKLPFDIFDDENIQRKSPEFDCGSGGFFDAEETCSTQTFNIFLKAQSVSTPKSLIKTNPQRQFGTILKEVPPPEAKEVVEIKSLIYTEENCPAENQNITPLPQTTNAFSPTRDRLSTILETSEHGTTQGTHTTGATTKSTISSPEFDIESQVIPSANVVSNPPLTVLEPVQELSCETSVDKMMESLKIQNIDSKSLSSTKNIETPVAMRAQNKYASDVMEKPTFEFSIKKDEKQVGNFSRLEEREDTAAGLVLKSLPSIRFQDDKTETIPKMLIQSQQFKFQDEKTETIPKIMLGTPIPTTIYLDDKTETVSKIFVEQPSSVKFPEDKTETISQILFKPAELKMFEDEEKELKDFEKDKNVQKNNKQDDSFEFFGLSPPKDLKQIPKKLNERASSAQVRTATECRTPLPFDSKRFCADNTTTVSKPTFFFKDELELKNKHAVDSKSNMNSSIHSDFLLNEEKQQIRYKPKSKSVFRDSFVPDFSLIEDSQPQAKEFQTKNQLTTTSNESILPQFSFTQNTKSSNPEPNNSSNVVPDFLQTKQIQTKSQLKSTTNESILPDFSFIKNTQFNKTEPNNSSNVAPDFLQTKQIQNKSQLKATSNESILPEFSFIKNTQFTKSEANNSSNVVPDFLQTKQIQNKTTSNESILPEFSFIKNTQFTKSEANNSSNVAPDFLQTKQIQTKSQNKTTSNESILPEFSFIQNTQSSKPEPNNSSNLVPGFLQNKQSQTKSQLKTTSDESLLPEFSFIQNTQSSKPQTNNSSAVVTNFLQTKQIQTKSQNKTTSNESILPEFSFIKNTQFTKSEPNNSSNVVPDFLQTKQIQNKSQLKTTSDEYILPDFSVIKNTQSSKLEPNNSSNVVPNVLQTKHIHNKSQLKTTSNESIVTDFSCLKITQPKSNHAENNNSRNMSIVSDFFHVPKTQPHESIKSSQTPQPVRFQQEFMSSSSATKDLDKYRTKNNITEPNIVSQSTADGTTMKNILMDMFVKDFNDINEQPSTSKDVRKTSLVKSYKNSSLKFLDDSLKQKSENSNNVPKPFNVDNIFSEKQTKLKFLTSPSSKDKLYDKEKQLRKSNTDKYFELNCETEMFGTNISMIKNSTWLPNHGPSASYNPYQAEQIQEKSLHIKCENVSTISTTFDEISKQSKKPEDDSLPKSKFCVDEKTNFNNDLSIEVNSSELAAIKANNLRKNEENIIYIADSPEKNEDDDDNNDMSIYYKHTPKTPKAQIHIWDDSEAFKRNSQNHYVHTDPDLNHTQQIIENIPIDPNVNPFNVDLINAFLEQHYVISYLESLSTCKLVGCTQRLKPNGKIDINGIDFSVIKLIGEGAYGAVFCGKESSTGKLVAMKQEKPPNFWEYYICLEIQERIKCDEMLQSYMRVNYALIGNNSSILISNFSQYGSLITVCNKIKKQTMKNVDEYVVMLLASELLEIIDHLHAVNIIHADVKADNFLLMNKLTYPSTERHLQLIDFGVSIDMKLFKEGQTFSFVHNENSFKCPEMRERRPWTYQLDLYGLAGVIHVLLFGKYMDIEMKARGYWMHKTHVPRYINKTLWDEIFKTLLNVRDCKTMPNLQDLRALLKKEMVEKEKYVLKMVNEFNRALSV